MSTRAGVRITDGRSSIHYYKHSDGYPEGMMPQLELFLSWVKEGKIRDNAPQSAGWLLIIGALEYNTIPACQLEKSDFKSEYGDIRTIAAPKDWKCGSFEPTDNVNNHGDLEYVYTIDLKKKKITYKKV